MPLNQRAMAALGFWALTSLSASLSITSSPRSAMGPLATCSPQRHTTQTVPNQSAASGKHGKRQSYGLAGFSRTTQKDQDSDETIKPLPCRFHDLRHTAVSRTLNAGVPIAKVAKIVGWSTATIVRMAARYGHFTLNELRRAMESISSTTLEGGPW